MGKNIAWLILLVFFLIPLNQAWAINDVVSVGPSNFEILSTDTAVLKTVVEANGGIATAFEVQPNYIDITLDNGSNAQFNTDGTVFFNIIKQSGTNNYNIAPACPTTSVTLSGTGAGPVVLRMRVYASPPPCGGGGGGGGGGGAIYPAEYSISINDGAVETTNKNVTLNLSAKNAAYFVISNNTSFVGLEWQPFSGEPLSLSWDLEEGFGTKAVYAMFKSLTGNLSYVISDSINLVAPEEESSEEVIPLAYEEFIPPPVVEEPAEHQDFWGTQIKYGDLLKGSWSTVYYYAKDGKRYLFPNFKTYFSWYADFSLVKTVSDEVIRAIPRGSNVTYRPGIKMIKMDTDPKVYAVDANGTLRWVVSEAVARALYGENWSKKIEDLPEVFFANYKIGTPIYSSSEFNPFEVASAAINIALDKNIGF